MYKSQVHARLGNISYTYILTSFIHTYNVSIGKWIQCSTITRYQPLWDFDAPWGLHGPSVTTSRCNVYYITYCLYKSLYHSEIDYLNKIVPICLLFTFKNCMWYSHNQKSVHILCQIRSNSSQTQDCQKYNNYASFYFCFYSFLGSAVDKHPIWWI